MKAYIRCDSVYTKYKTNQSMRLKGWWSLGRLVTGGSYNGDMKGLWGTGNILFFGMGATYMDLLGL